MEGGQEGESWEESCLNKFSKCLGMSIAGFEEEFLLLMSRISERRQQDKGKGVQRSTKFDRELKKLTWTVKDKESLKLRASGRGARGTSSFLC